jgi:DNA-binding winged helix-turn-helix (wHTH) protein
MRFRFGECVLDGETRELRVAGETVHLSPKALQFLELLLANRPRALSKAEIHEELWPDTFVADGTLTSLLAEVRSAIGDGRQGSRFIRTVHRFGYAFSGTAEEEAARPPRRQSSPQFAYRLFWGPREIALEQGETILGRDLEAAVFLDHKSVSRHHARITISGSTVTIEDLGSKNGTFVRGERATAPSRLADGDVVRLGSIDLIFRLFTLSGSTETAGGR